MKFEIEWSQPDNLKPPTFKEKWLETIKQLDERPGEWAIIARDMSPTIVTNLKRHFKDYEFTARNVQNYRAERIYARKRI